MSVTLHYRAAWASEWHRGVEHALDKVLVRVNLYLFAELLSEARDDARAEQLLSSVAKTACFIMH